MFKKSFVVLAVLAIAAMMIAACAPAAPAAEEAAPAEEAVVEEAAPAEEAMEEEMMANDVAFYLDPLAQTGDVVSAGSSTVFPLASKMAERLLDEGFPGSITIDSVGSGGGFERFCETGETDVSNASRAIKDVEVDACAAIGRTPIEFRVGTDAIAVVVSAENTFLPDDISLEQLATIFSTAEKWSDVDPSWPAENILRYIPGTDSGTFDFFTEVVFDEDKEPILNAANTELSEDDNILVQGILGSQYAIGFFGYAYYAENADSFRILSLDGVAPVRENVDAFTYPLARPLFIYSDAAIMQEKPQVASYILYFLTYVNEEIEEVGYFAAGGGDLFQAKMAWFDAMQLEVSDPLAQTGDVVSAGSSTVFPLASKMAERLLDEGFPGSITIDSVGSGGGFERFCETGETDVSNASRAIKDVEVDACAAIGRTPIEFRVGTDAIAVVVSAENTFLPDDISLEQLATIFSTAEKWSDVDPSWPAENILRYIPGTDSGTFDFFTEVVFDEDKEPILNAANTELSEDDNILVQGILGSQYAIGFFGYAYYAENADSFRILSLDGVAPVRENVDAFTYPLARPLFIYSDAAIMQEKPQVASYILYFLTYVNEEIEEVGYFAAGDSDLAGGLDSWISAVSQ
jgi:phosphate transport system substrate-binding protein